MAAGSGSTPNGRLYVVATPIGNLSDITLRAVDILKSVRVVACEDTRRSRVLLAHIEARPKRLVSLHDHNETSASDTLVTTLRAGDDVALVSDAGTPLLSDPGFELVRRAWRHHVRIVPVPGPSALTAALAVSPIPLNRFRFEGFLPAKAVARRAMLRGLLASDVPVVFFETPHRLRTSLADLAELGGGNRRLLVCRELTKRHETLSFATVSAMLASQTVLDRGEFVCVLAGSESAPTSADVEAVVRVLAADLPAGQAARLAAKITGRPRGELYRLAVSIAAR